MRTYHLGVLKGDGIGPEIMDATLAAVEAAARQAKGLQLVWQFLPIGWEAIRSASHPIPPHTLQALEACHGFLVGPHDSVSYPETFKGELNPSGRLRVYFGLFANIRPARTYTGLSGLVANTDLVIVRENTQGFYADRNMVQGCGEYMPTPDVALTTGVVTRQATERIAHVAFRLARSRRRRVSVVHKANVIKLAHGLFLDTCREVSRCYPEVQIEDYHIDAMAAHLVRRAQDFDVILTTNMFGDILSDLTAELVGSLGLAGSLNIGDHHGMAQAVHGAAPDIAGQGVANPVGLIHSAAMLLDWLAEQHADERLRTVSQKIQQAVAAVLAAGPRTPDLGGTASTTEFAQALVDKIEEIGAGVTPM